MESNRRSEVQIVPQDYVLGYISDVKKHLKELSDREVEYTSRNVSIDESQKQNAKSLLLFHDKLTKFLKFCEIRIVSQEEDKMQEKVEKILKTLLTVQSSMNRQGNNNDVQNAIAQLRSEIRSNSDKVLSNQITELLENFAKSSETLHQGLQQMNDKIDKLQASVDSNQAQLMDSLSNKPRVSQEELKQSEIAAAQRDSGDQGFSSLFSFLNDLDSLKSSDYQFKEKFKYQMVHPFKLYDKDTAIERMDQIQVTLDICTLLNGVPHGLAVIQYTDHLNIFDSFSGACFFNHGKLHNTPFICVTGGGCGLSFSKMENGRPADGSYYTCFNKNGDKQHVDSKEAKTDVSGWQWYSGQVDKERRRNGQGKHWGEDGGIYTGGYKNNKKTEGKKYELQGDRTHSLFLVKYEEDHDEEEIKRKLISKGLKNVY